jgi:membrane carboxypeptidase/penicillin-binding protein PbpC
MDRILEVISNTELWAPTSLHLLDELSVFEKMVLKLEDRRYFGHPGFDYRCFARIGRQIITLKRIGGVSTIEQQFVRTVLERNERTIKRKTRELFLAWVLTYRASKISVLRSYLAIVYLGYRIRGCDEAARLIFGKDAAQLSADAAAFVAALMVYPLPKVVRRNAEDMALLPTADSASLLSYSRAVAPKWSARVERRMKYALALSKQSEKTL